MGKQLKLAPSLLNRERRNLRNIFKNFGHSLYKLGVVVQAYNASQHSTVILTPRKLKQEDYLKFVAGLDCETCLIPPQNAFNLKVLNFKTSPQYSSPFYNSELQRKKKNNPFTYKHRHTSLIQTGVEAGVSPWKAEAVGSLWVSVPSPILRKERFTLSSFFLNPFQWFLFSLVHQLSQRWMSSVLYTLICRMV